MSAIFNATPAELSLVNRIFAQADKQKLGILTGDVAVNVFSGAKLPGPVLGEIWSIADEENNGWLSKTGAAKALRLIAHAQKGEKPSPALLTKPGPLPNIEGYAVIPQQNTGASIPKSPTPGFPPLSPQDKIKFQNIFNRSGPVNGLLNGEKARDIFLRSKLSNEHLMQIWNLADTRDRGALDVADFTIAMYFIQGLMSQQISFVPTTLPPGLYEQTGGSGAPSPVVTHLSGNSASMSPVNSNFGRLQPQYTGQSQHLAPDHTGLSAQHRAPTLPVHLGSGSVPFRAPVAQENGHYAWDVSPSEKAEADAIFDSQLDTKRVGFIDGDTAVPFMLKSQLPGEDLAQIWDLADVNKDGRLTRDGFAVALHLIKKKLAGQPLPAELPLSLMPPSLRKQTSFFQVPAPQPEPARDLLDLDDTPPVSAVSPQATGTMAVLQPQSTGATTIPPIPPRNNIIDPFASSPFSSSPPFTSTANRDLLEDHEDRPHTVSPPLQDQSAELGNLKNQVQSINKALETAKAERAKLESNVASQAAELSALQTQLSLAKASHDTETNLLSQLKERYTTQSAEIQKVREELIRSESDLSAIRVEKAEIEQVFLRDKEEARDLHRRMIEAGQQTDQLKLEIEKVKKEAKQQKGRLAIARKQLSTKETERAKVEKELEEANTEVEATTQEACEVEAQLTKLNEQSELERTTSPDSIALAATHPLPASPDSMTASKRNNPFERLGISSGSPSPRSQSPFLPFNASSLASPHAGVSEDQNDQVKSVQEPSFDDFFGVNETVPTVEQSPKPAQENGDMIPKGVNSIMPASPLTATDTEHFVTPPTTANNTGSGSPEALDPTSAAQAKFPSVDDATVHFPPVQDVTNNNVGKGQDNEPSTTDLDMKLQELEAEESDSDESDDDDDDEPLAEVVQKVKDKTNTSVAQTSPVEETVAVTETAPPPDQPKSSFDDIFTANDTLSAPASEAPQPASSPFDIPALVQPSESTKSNATAGVNAFDETLSGFSPPPSAAPAQFSFDAFEDSFDFGVGSAQPTPSQPEPAAVPIPEPTAAAQQHTTTAPAADFDDLFALPSKTAVPQQQTIPASTTNGTTQVEATASTSFDDAFAAFDNSPNLNLESSFTSISANPSTTEAQATPSKPFPTSPTPTSPRTVDTSSPRPSVGRTSSPAPRPASPPARMTSPAPRPSTSSKDGHERTKEPPTRHSKLSIRFPFGKKNKNKHQDTMPPPPTLAPPREDANRATTPASEDDVEAVKQITAMGFSRSQAVEALEKYGYDVQRAINSLLQ